MGKTPVTIFLCYCLFSTWVSAQSESDSSTSSEINKQPQHPALAAFSDCLRAAVEAERANNRVSEASLSRVKNTCQTELAAVKKALPPSIVEQMMALLDEGLQRELNH